MQNWIAIILIGLASLLIALVAVLWRPQSVTGRAGTGVAEDTPQSRGNQQSLPADAPEPGAVPNTRISPHPEDEIVAILEFGGSLGKVAIRRGETVIGRHSSDDIRVPDVRVSRHHARLVARSDGRFEIHNLTAVRSEPNPMLVNGVHREHCAVTDGDVITLGGVSFNFRQTAS
ncbi:MAG: FHA domain-containing protein [Hyphomicrobiaceae bacterium]